MEREEEEACARAGEDGVLYTGKVCARAVLTVS
jgi:hypothetical protein